MKFNTGRNNKFSRLYDNLENYVSLYFPAEIILSEEEQRVKELCESSFFEFVKHAWVHVEGRPYIDSWHIQALCEHLESLYKLEIKNLLVNLPPRVGKSMLISVIFPAWCWIVNPGLRFLYTAYSETLTVRDSVFCRRLIASEWYQKLWGQKFKIRRDVDNKLRFDNDKFGYRIATSVGGTVTGQGADFIVCDDPNNMQTVHSEVSRETVKRFFDYTLPTRFSVGAQRRRIVVQQRTHEDDLTGHILSKKNSNWVFCCLPMEFEKHRKCSTIILPMSNGKVWSDPRKTDGELLCPQIISREFFKELKDDLNNDSYMISAQFQQRPSPALGGMLKGEWLNRWQAPLPEFQFILQSWDTALTSGKLSCFSSCTTWGVFKDYKTGVNNIMLLSLFKEQIEYPELRKAATRLARNYEDIYLDDDPLEARKPPDLILVEQQVNGFCILQDLMRANLPVMKFVPGRHGNKVGRCRIVSHLMENGLVWLPTQAPHYKHFTEDSKIFLEAAMKFPEDRSGKPTNDIIDSMSQAFITFMTRGWTANTNDPSDHQGEPEWKNLEHNYGNVWKYKN